MFTHRVHIQIAPNKLFEDPQILRYLTSQFSGRKKRPFHLVSRRN